MMPTDTVLESLWLATWTSSLAILIVLLLRAPVRDRFGAGIAYALWWLPLATWLALWLPARVVDVPAPPVTAATTVASLATLTAVTPTQTFDLGALWLPLWLSGLGAMLVLSWRQQRRFERGLGRLHALPGEARAWRADASSGLPALVGLLRPRIILPADIDARFDDEQCGLMLAHERIHLGRGDAWVNSLATLARCVFWFNPLVHIAAARLRHDQELACDARVIAAFPHSRRAYGEAMLKNVTSPLVAPLGCHWGITHPMKERVMLLKNALPSRNRRVAGALLVGVAAVVVAAAAWAALPPRQGSRSSEVNVRSEGRDFQVALDIAIDGAAPQDILVLGRYGKPFTVRIEDSETGSLALKGTVTQSNADGAPGYRIETQLERDGKLIGTPVLQVAAGKTARIKTGKQSSTGEFAGVDIQVQIGDVDPAAIQAHHQAETAPHQVEQTRAITRQAHGDAATEARLGMQAADEARVAAAGAQKAAQAAAGMSADDARVAAEAARVAAMDAAEAAEDAARAAAEQENNQRIERKVIRRTMSAPPAPPPPPSYPRNAKAPPAPPKPPVPPAPNAATPPLAPLAPPAAPAVMSGNASMHIEREVRKGTAPAAPARTISINTVEEAVAAGARELTPAQAAAAGLKPGYRWVDIKPLMSDKGALSMGIEASIFSVPEDGEGPHHAGYKP